MKSTAAWRTPAEVFGPWVPGLDATERIAQFRALQALVAVFLGPRNQLVAALRSAENDGAAAAEALALLNAVPTLTRRRLSSTFCSVMWPRGAR
jgi:hypothetical protein